MLRAGGGAEIAVGGPHGYCSGVSRNLGTIELALNLGVLAPELPPGAGGMERLAAGLTRALAEHPQVSELRVVTREDSVVDEALPGSSIIGHALLNDDLHQTAGRLEALPVPDVWLALNAGLAPLAGKLPGRLALYAHGNDFLRPWIACGPRSIERLRWPYVAPLRHALRRRAIGRALFDCAVLLANSRPTGDRLLALDRRAAGAEPALEVEVVPPGIAASWFEEPLPEVTSRGARPFRLLTVARLARATDRKNIDGLLQAVAMLVRDSVRVELRIVGDGDDRGRLEALARELDLAGRVQFLGRLDDLGLRAEYTAADLFVLASRATAGDVEGFGMVYVEAAACGTPSLAHRAGGAVDAVAEGRSGFFVDSPDASALAGELARLVGLEAQPKSGDGHWPSAEACREHARQFRWPGIADRLVRILLKSVRP